MKGNGSLIGLIGIWIILTSFISVDVEFIFWSNIVSGGIIAIAGFTMIKKQPELGLIAGVFGIWMIISAFIPSLLTEPGLLWNGIIAGLIAAIDGFSAEANTPRRTAHQH
ncbi:MAG TPA: hypothetical protein VJ964_12690 [Balneolaceae bacterium]|nr:hypothetical protein [Balneolaceae bacterium]